MVSEDLTRAVGRAAENAWLKFTVRAVLPVLIAVTSSLAVVVLNDVRNRIIDQSNTIVRGQKSDADARLKLWEAEGRLGGLVANISSDVKVLSQRVADDRQRSDEADRRLDAELSTIVSRMARDKK